MVLVPMGLLVLAASSTSAFAPAGIVRPAASFAQASPGLSLFRQETHFLRRLAPRSTRACRLRMSAARGDACLAAAATALGAGDVVGAQENLDKARMEYMRAGEIAIRERCQSWRHVNMASKSGICARLQACRATIHWF